MKEEWKEKAHSPFLCYSTTLFCFFSLVDVLHLLNACVIKV